MCMCVYGGVCIYGWYLSRHMHLEMSHTNIYIHTRYSISPIPICLQKHPVPFISLSLIGFHAVTLKPGWARSIKSPTTLP